LRIKEKIFEWATELLPDEALFVVDVIVKGQTEELASKVLVLLDGDQGVDIDSCALVSRALGERLEETELFTKAYTLEVSSPGLDYPLQTLRQYPKNYGRRVRVLLKDGREVFGTLQNATEQGIELLPEATGKGGRKKPSGPPKKGQKPAETAKLAFDDIDKTFVLVTF